MLSCKRRVESSSRQQTQHAVTLQHYYAGTLCFSHAKIGPDSAEDGPPTDRRDERQRADCARWRVTLPQTAGDYAAMDFAIASDTNECRFISICKR